ncbi:MAG: hypothetical protein ACRELG_09850 [Gemmataceae bacterium]
MKKLARITLAAAIVVMAVGPALAQQRQRQPGGRGFGGFGGGTVFLLGQKSVQEELKLSDDQVKQVKELQEKQRGSFQGLRDLSQEERVKKVREQREATQKAVAGILKPAQLKRVKQISLQQMGAFALSTEEVAKALKITDDQKGKIREIQTKASEERRALGRGEESRAKREELRKATNEKVMGVLTAEQKTKLKEQQGKPFDLTKIERRPARNRRNQN